MTPEEAIAVLEDRQICRECVHSLNNSEEFECGCDECDNAFGMAYDALQKQIPKKPLYIDGDCDLPLCPHCRMAIDETEDTIVCKLCRQALDWSDVI